MADIIWTKGRRQPWGPQEYVCSCHGVGHSNGIHGCVWNRFLKGPCCSDPKFPPRAYAEYVYWPCLQPEDHPFYTNDSTSNTPSSLWTSPDESGILGLIGSIGLIVDEDGEPCEATPEFWEAVRSEL